MPGLDGLDVDLVRTMTKGSVHLMARRVLKPGMTAVDVGAANGEICQTMRECIGPTGRLIAFEPRATCIEGAPNEVHRMACSDYPGQQGFHVAKPETGSSFHKILIPNVDSEKISVPVTTLDAHVTSADLVKLDVQGAEVDVLLGATKLLQACPAWILEVWPFGLMAAHRSLDDLLKILHKNGLVPHDADHQPIPWERVALWVLRMKNPLKHANWLCLRP